jgi:hypothetical protein
MSRPQARTHVRACGVFVVRRVGVYAANEVAAGKVAAMRG